MPPRGRQEHVDARGDGGHAVPARVVIEMADEEKTLLEQVREKEVALAEEEGWTLEQYTREVYEFERTLYHSGFIIRFDWPRWEPDAFRFYRDQSLLETADCGVLRRLLTFHIRKNVVCEGHLAGMLRDGQVQAILRRLAALVGETSDGPIPIDRID